MTDIEHWLQRHISGGKLCCTPLPVFHLLFGRSSRFLGMLIASSKPSRGYSCQFLNLPRIVNEEVTIIINIDDLLGNLPHRIVNEEVTIIIDLDDLLGNLPPLRHSKRFVIFNFAIRLNLLSLSFPF